MMIDFDVFKDNNVKITCFVWAEICFAVACFFSMCETTEMFHFVRIPHGNTGEPISIIGSLLVYIFVYFIANTVFSSGIAVFALFFSSCLEKTSTKKTRFSEESELAMSLAFTVTPFITGIIFFLIMFGVIVIP